MNPYNTTSPVIFCIFNRPTSTQRVFKEIAKAKPPALYVVADAARPQVEGEAELCLECRAIAEQVDWPCEVTLDYAEDNMGCKQRIYSGISNAFEQFEFAIILEDDCLPCPDFFRFIDTIRERYKSDEQVMHISGTSFVRPKNPNAVYYRSAYPLVWGWATWKRTWVGLDLSMKNWPKLKARLTSERSNYSTTHSRFLKHLEKAYTGRVNTWDYPYCAHIMNSYGNCITPLFNLVKNIGFGKESTHTGNSLSPQSNLPHDKLPYEICPTKVAALHNYYSEIQLENGIYRPRKIMRMFYKICSYLRFPIKAKLYRPREQKLIVK